MTRRTNPALLASVFAALALVVGAACSVSENLSAPRCDSSSSSVLISGQSVPTAEFLVCFDTIPAGWEVASVDIGHNGTFVVFHSDRAGGAAAQFRYEESCDIGEATSIPTEFDRTSRYEWILEVDPRFRANRYYRFEGGCVTWEFDFDADASAALAVELGSSLQFVDREMVNNDMRQEFVDKDL